MTSTTGTPRTDQPVETVSAVIDGMEVSAPKGTLIIRAAETLGVAIPRFCDHPLLDPVAACRQCLVEVATPGPDGSLRAMPKPQPSCAIELTEGMVVKTQVTSPVADKAQQGQLEFLLINHPLDCPVCDKGGECPLQNQAMSNGRPETRFVDVKRTFPKPIRISSQVLLDRERCVLCQRCTRFAKEIAGDPFIELQERGAQQQIGTFSPAVLGIHVPDESVLDQAGEPFASYFSGNTIQICPVGALTSAAYRFRARPFDLVSSPSVCEHCASGCALRVDHRRGTVLRRLAGEDPAVNEEWNCDKGRFAFTWQTAADRVTTPMVRDADTGQLVPASWSEALDAAAQGLTAARDADVSTAGHRGGVGVLVGGRATVEDAYAYAKFARLALGTNDVDFRARPHSAEEADVLAARVAGAGMPVTYADLERAPAVLLVAFEPEEESPIVFLRLRKAVRKHGLQVAAVAPMATRGLTKLSGALVEAAPGTEPSVLRALAASAPEVAETAELLRRPGAVVLVGERLAAVPGGLTAAAALADATGAALAWVPRRAGERGALEAGALPTLLPGGRPVADPEARVDTAAAWGTPVSLPDAPGRDTAAMLAAAASGELGALVVGGVDPVDLPDPELALTALDRVPFLVSLEVRLSAVTDRADVVLPVAPVAEKSGTFLSWEGRWRMFERTLQSRALPDLRVLDELAAAMGVDLGTPTVEAVRGELAELGAWEGGRLAAAPAEPVRPPEPAPGEAVLATWHLLLDAGRLQDGEPFLAGTAQRAHARLSAATAAEAGVDDGGLVEVATDAGAVRLPVVVTAMPDRVVWLPTNSPGSSVHVTLRAGAGSVVRVAAVPADAVEEVQA
ncbi:NADH-quinone oxidoreductase subunit G [Quadrisphaera sp. GCM10027208]|uniref:NADH-quinone oxidoreductase subunit G n=1 Tax=Quadrisphaera sp. GCM10027208 TaxID=3273423 RepID=UPI0036240548